MTRVLNSGVYRKPSDRFLAFCGSAMFLMYVESVWRSIADIDPAVGLWVHAMRGALLYFLLPYLIIRSTIDLAEDVIDSISWLRPKLRVSRWASLDITNPDAVKFDREVDTAPLNSIAHRMSYVELFLLAPFAFASGWYLLEQHWICNIQHDYTLPYLLRLQCRLAIFALGGALVSIGIRNGSAAVPLAYRIFGVKSWRRKAAANP